MKKGFILLTICLLSGCASLFSNDLAIRTLPVVTSPEGAVISVVDVGSGKAVTDINARTPYNVVVDRDDGYFFRKHYEIRLTLPGYIPEKTDLTPGLSPWYFANIVAGVVPGMLIIDPLTGAMWRYNIDGITMKLFPDTPEGRLARDEYYKSKRN